jgi:hypothetical protein
LFDLLALFRCSVTRSLPQRRPRFAAVYQTLSSGFIDEGWKDVVLVMPGERVKLLMKFTDHTGLYIYHCHILEHEDLGMMRNYLVRA